MRLLTLTTALLASSLALATPLPHESRVPGGIALVPLPAGTSPDAAVYFGERKIWVLPDDKGQRLAVVGIPLGTKDQITLRISDKTDTQLPVAISPKQYAEQHLTVASTYVDLKDDDVSRYKREAAEQAAVYVAFHPVAENWPTFQMPIQGTVVNSSFGKQRFFNGQARAPHSGLDIEAPEGKDAMAPADGVVAQTGSYFFNGNTVMIDHGNGLVSMLCHLSKIAVKPGQLVKAGDVIGQVGHTGRATGPHLHWGVSLNDARIDPRLVFLVGKEPPEGVETPDAAPAEGSR